MSCGEPDFWNKLFEDTVAKNEKKLSEANPFQTIEEKEEQAKIQEFFDAEQERAMHAAVAERQTTDELVTKAYVDQQIEENVLIANDKYALGISPRGAGPVGDVYVDTDAEQVYVSDGNGYLLAAAPPPAIDLQNVEGSMVIASNGLTVKTDDGEVDVLAKLAELEELVYRLSGMNAPDIKINLPDPDLEYFRSKLERGLKPAKDRLAFDEAMKGV